MHILIQVLPAPNAYTRFADIDLKARVFIWTNYYASRCMHWRKEVPEWVYANGSAVRALMNTHRDAQTHRQDQFYTLDRWCVRELRPPRGSLKLIFTQLINLVSLEQSHPKAIGMCGSVSLLLTFVLNHHNQHALLLVCDEITPVTQDL